MPHIIAIITVILLLTGGTAVAAEPPARGLSAAFNYPGLTLGPQDQVELAVAVRNLGAKDDTFKVTVLEYPEKWDVEVRNFSAVVTGIFLPGQEQGNLTLWAAPQEDGERLPTGSYHFKIKVESADGQLFQTSECRVEISERRKTVDSVALSTSYPEVRGPSDSRFSFSLDVKNQDAEDALINLMAIAPDGWETAFKPSYEDKQISSIHIPKGQSRSLSLDITPGHGTEAGVYPVKIKAEAPRGTTETTLRVALTGTYKIRAVSTNELLSTATEAGQPVTVSLFIINEGSAIQREISFLAVKPDNWKVEFKPEKLAELAPGSTPVPLEMTITPPADALVGDYGVGFSAEGEKSRSNLDFRVTVKGKAAWAWVGSAIIAFVVIGLGLAFRRLGRR